MTGADPPSLTIGRPAAAQTYLFNEANFATGASPQAVATGVFCVNPGLACDGELEPINEDAMRWSLILLAMVGAHGEPPSRDRRERRGGPRGT